MASTSASSLARAGLSMRVLNACGACWNSLLNGIILAQLAALAAMSPSSLRSKFRQRYGCTLFDYLRDCRLALARRYLLEGHSVQQAA